MTNTEGEMRCFLVCSLSFSETYDCDSIPNNIAHRDNNNNFIEMQDVPRLETGEVLCWYIQTGTGKIRSDFDRQIIFFSVAECHRNQSGWVECDCGLQGGTMYNTVIYGKQVQYKREIDNKDRICAKNIKLRNGNAFDTEFFCATCWEKQLLVQNDNGQIVIAN